MLFAAVVLAWFAAVMEAIVTVVPWLALWFVGRLVRGIRAVVVAARAERPPAVGEFEPV